jgi:hypothetical protein
MMRIGLESDEPSLSQVVDDPLHVLAISAHVPSEPSDRLWAAGVSDGAEYFPACARQPELRHQSITGGQEQVVEPEEVEDEISQGITGRGSFGASRHCHHHL